MKHRVVYRLPRVGGICFLLANAAGCAQILGTNDYRVGAKDSLADGGSDATHERPTTSSSEPGSETQSETASGSDETTTSRDTDTETSEPTETSDPRSDPPDASEPDTTVDDCGEGKGVCTIAPQCGCPAGENCTVSDPAEGTTRCVAAGNTEPYAPCDETAGECSEGYACVGGVCKAVCGGVESKDCDGDDICTQVTVSGAPAPDYFVCQRVCNPVDPTDNDAPFTACGEGANCAPGPDGASACIGSRLTGTEGISCVSAEGPNSDGCAPGFGCVPLVNGAVCLRNCDLEGNDCAAGDSCVAYAESVGAGERAIGYCKTCQVPAGSECDPVAQCGCTADKACSIVDYTTGQAGCIEPGTVPELGECTGFGEVGECEPGNDCMSWWETGICSRFCEQDSDCPNPNGGCAVWGDWETQVSKMCLRGCDPRNPQSSEGPFLGCPDDQTCSPWYVNQNSNCVVPEVLGEEGDACEDEDNCGPGLSCGVDGGHSCTRWCDLAGNDCLPEEFCLPHARFQMFSLTLPAAGVDMGVCMAIRWSSESTDTPLPLNDAPEEGGPAETTSSIEVSDFPGFLSHVAVTVTIPHTYIQDLDLFLIAPDGTQVQLVRGADFDAPLGEGYSETMFDDASLVQLIDITEPFTEVVAPLEPLWGIPLASEDGIDPNGSWTLLVVDSEHGDTGQLTSWSLLLF